MARGNDGVMTGTLPYPPQANQDQRYFPLGASKALPAAGYEEDSKKSVEQLLAERDRRGSE
jgi:hypothetical protein